MSHYRACRSARPGFATVLAIVLIGLVGATLAGMAAFSAAEVRRSRALADGARLRQLLIAGAADVIARAPSWKASPPDATWTLALPYALKDEARVEIHLEPVQDGTASAQITARLRGHMARQNVRLAQTGTNWEVEGTDLESQ